jgi:hypothetical protein
MGYVALAATAFGIAASPELSGFALGFAYLGFLSLVAMLLSTRARGGVASRARGMVWLAGSLLIALGFALGRLRIADPPARLALLGVMAAIGALDLALWLVRRRARAR